MRHGRCLAVASLLAAGCGGHSTGEPMSHHLTMVSEDLDGLAREAAAHKSAQAAAAKVSDLVALEDDHLSLVNGRIDDMKGMCDDISESCMDDKGKMADARSMSDLAAQMRQECANHRAAMAAAADLTAASAEEARHQGALSDLRGRMQSGIEAMSAGAAGYTCSASGHSH